MVKVSWTQRLILAAATDGMTIDNITKLCCRIQAKLCNIHGQGNRPGRSPTSELESQGLSSQLGSQVGTHLGIQLCSVFFTLSNRSM